MYKRVVAVGVAAISIGCLAACGSSSPHGSKPGDGSGGSKAPLGPLRLTKSPSPVQLVLSSPGGDSQEAMKKRVEEPFTEATGHTFTNISPPDIAKIASMEAAGKPVWDVVALSPQLVNAQCGKYFEKIDASLYPDLDKYPAGTVTPCMVPDVRYADIFSYNTDKFGGNPPTSIKDFFDTDKYPGKRLVVDLADNGLYEAALVAAGVDPDNLYPLDIARAQKEMDKIKHDLILAPTYAAAQQALVSGQAAMTIMVTARTEASVAHGAHLAPVWDFTSYTLDGFAILKDAPHVDVAQQLVAFTTTKPIEIAHAVANGFAPVNPDVKLSDIPYTPLQKQFNAFQSDRGTVTLQDPGWYTENFNKLVTAYTRWKVT